MSLLLTSKEYLYVYLNPVFLNIDSTVSAIYMNSPNKIATSGAN